ncbi:tail assembly chaperone [Sporosarcina sp. ITBMC105]
MATFEINGKEYELKIDLKAAQYLNSIYDGGSFDVIGKAMMGDLDLFPHIIHAGLRHTKENFSFAQVEEAIVDATANEKLDLDGILKLSNEVITQSFFYKKTVEKLLKDNKQARKAIDQLLK